MPSKDACLKTDGSFVAGPPVAILAADGVGFVRLMETDERDPLSRLKRLCDRELFPLKSDNGGRVGKTTGDGYLAVFETAEIAMRCAIILKRRVHSLQNETPAERKILFRMAVHVSHVIKEGNDIFGDGVNVASLLQSFAETGGVAVSQIVTESITDLSAIDLGGRRRSKVVRGVVAVVAVADQG